MNPTPMFTVDHDLESHAQDLMDEAIIYGFAQLPTKQLLCTKEYLQNQQTDGLTNFDLADFTLAPYWITHYKVKHYVAIFVVEDLMKYLKHGKKVYS